MGGRLNVGSFKGCIEGLVSGDKKEQQVTTVER